MAFVNNIRRGRACDHAQACYKPARVTTYWHKPLMHRFPTAQSKSLLQRVAGGGVTHCP